MPGGSLDLEELTRRRLRPVVDVHGSAVMLAVEACAVGEAEPWAASVLERLAAVHRRALRPMVETGLVPDVVLDLEHHGRGWRDRVRGIARSRPRDLVAELVVHDHPGFGPAWSEALRRPERWLSAVGHAAALVLPVARALFAADRPHLERLVTEIDRAADPEEVGRLLSELHGRTWVEDGCWRLPGESRVAPHPAADGLVVVPTLTTPDRALVALRGDEITTLFAGVSTPLREHVALQALLGSMRAALLRCLDGSRTMTELGERLSIVASAVTYHVAALEQMGLALRRRRGRCVTVRRTERGDALLDLYGPVGLGSRHQPAVVSSLRVT